jgi:imidazolonepropionase-like amidohydrolase
MAGDAVELADHARFAAAPSAPAPRVYFAALVAGPSFFDDPRPRASAHGGEPGRVPWLRAVQGSTDLAALVGEARATGATGIKIYANLDAELVAAVSEEAHLQGMRVWSHATVYPASPLEVVQAGVDVVSHANYLAWQIASRIPDTYAAGFQGMMQTTPPPPDHPAIDLLLDEMLARGTLLEPTLGVTHAREPSAAPGSWAAFSDAVTARAHARGVRLVAGTDGMAPAGGQPNIHLEMELLVEYAGLSTMEAITAATANAAEAIGRADEVGTIEPGKLADLVILDADPLADIHDTRRVVFVVKGGFRHVP